MKTHFLWLVCGCFGSLGPCGFEDFSLLGGLRIYWDRLFGSWDLSKAKIVDPTRAAFEVAEVISARACTSVSLFTTRFQNNEYKPS